MNPKSTHSWKEAQQAKWYGQRMNWATRIKQEYGTKGYNYVILYKHKPIIRYNANGVTLIRIPSDLPLNKALLTRFELHSPVTITRVRKKKLTPAHWIIVPNHFYLDEDDEPVTTPSISTLKATKDEWILIPSDPTCSTKAHNPAVQQRLCL